MIDFNQLEKYRENNRIEAKKALGGLPKSIWETYSAFANTLGGMILLGVEEFKDKSLHAVDLPDPEGLIREFWAIVKDPSRTSVNILSEEDVYSLEVEGKHIIVIQVPRAERSQRPVYVDGNSQNTYRRNGEGDYRCTPEEYQRMVRDAAVKSQDLQVIQEMGMEVFSPEAVKNYRIQIENSLKGQEYKNLSESRFLEKIGGVSMDAGGSLHTTAAGLLFFGLKKEIVRIYENFSLEYVEQKNQTAMPSFKIATAPEGAIENIFDFYVSVTKHLLENTNEKLHADLLEALVNCLVNADYYGLGGVRIIKRENLISFSNPGDLRMEKDAIVSGGVSDPRNTGIKKLFHLLGMGKGCGVGVPSMMRTWQELGLDTPRIVEKPEEGRVTFLLPLSERKLSGKMRKENQPLEKQWVIEFLTDYPDCDLRELQERLRIRTGEIKEMIEEMRAEGLIESYKDGDLEKYRLRY